MRSRLMQIVSFLFLLACSAFGQTTTITGTINDLTNNPVTSGKVVFTLKPSVDTTISGNARFTPGQPVTCYIQSNGTLLNAAQTGACTVISNTSLTPAGTSYRVDICPYMACSSSFNFYAINSSYNISTIVPTPTTGPAQNFADVFSNQTIAGNKTFTGTTVFSGVSLTGCSYNNAPYVGSSCFPTVASAVAALPSGQGRVYIMPGTYAGPAGSVFGSNQEFICAGPSVAQQVAGSFNSNAAAAVVTQCVFQYTTTFTLNRVFNTHFVGITWDGQANPVGWLLRESQWNIFDDCSVVRFGYASGNVPAVQLTSVDAGWNVSHNLFRNFGMWPNFNAIGMQLIGTGTVNAGPAVTDNTFIDITCTNTWLYCIDFELNTDTNFFYHVEGNEDASTLAAAGLIAFNTLNPSSDQDADNELIVGAYTSGAIYLVTAGQGGGEVYVSTSTCPLSQVNVLGGNPHITIHGDPFFGTPGCMFFSDSVAIGTSSGHYATIHGVLSNSATLTFGSIGADTCSEQSITVTGASTTGSAAWASENAALGNINLSWSAWVEATNTVNVRVCNVTAGNITPNAVTWTAWVIQ